MWTSLLVHLRVCVGVTKCGSLQEVLVATREFGRSRLPPGIIARSWLCELLLHVSCSYLTLM